MTITFPTTPRQWHARVWHMTWPVIIANITIPMVGVADVAVMGRLPDPVYIAAVAMGAAMFSAMYWMFGFLRMGTTGLVAQAMGGNDIPTAVAVFFRAGVIAATLGSAIILLQWPLQTLLFQLFEPDAQLAAHASTYFRLRIFGAPGLLVHLVELGILFGLQRMRDTLWLSLALNVSNLVLDVVLVLGFGMGTAGVALGTAVSEWGAAGLGAWLAIRALKQAGWQGHLPRNLWQKAPVLRLFNLSGNLVLRTFFVQLPFFVGAVAATSIGQLTLAAHGVLMQLFFVMTSSLDGFAHTAETLAGYSYGARNPQQLRQASIYCTVWALLLSIITATTYLLAGEVFINLLTLSPEVRQTAITYLPWLALAPLFCVWAFLFDGIFIGTTHIVEMRNSMIIAAVVWAGVLWWTFDDMAYHGVWLAMNGFMLVRGLLLAGYYPRIERAAAPVAQAP